MQDSFDLPQDYFAQLPNDLRLDVSRVGGFVYSNFCDWIFFFFWVLKFSANWVSNL